MLQLVAQLLIDTGGQVQASVTLYYCKHAGWSRAVHRIRATIIVAVRRTGFPTASHRLQ